MFSSRLPSEAPLEMHKLACMNVEHFPTLALNMYATEQEIARTEAKATRAG